VGRRCRRRCGARLSLAARRNVSPIGGGVRETLDYSLQGNPTSPVIVGPTPSTRRPSRPAGRLEAAARKLLPARGAVRTFAISAARRRCWRGVSGELVRYAIGERSGLDVIMFVRRPSVRRDGLDGFGRSNNAAAPARRNGRAALASPRVGHQLPRGVASTVSDATIHPAPGSR